MTTPRPPPPAAPPAPAPTAGVAPASAAHGEPGRAAPTARARRLESLASEGGLLLLSLMLALMIWFIVRGLIEATVSVPVRVHALERQGFKVDVQEGLTLHLRGPRGEVEDALALLEERGNVVYLEPGPLLSGAERDLDQRDRIRLPFKQRLLESPPAPPKGKLIRLELGRAVRVLPPATYGLPPDRRPLVTLEPDRLLLDAPTGALSDEIQPDPIDLKPLLALPGQSHRVPLTFERWRTGTADRTLPPEVLALPPEVVALPPDVLRRRAAVVIRGPVAVVRFETVATAALANALQIVVKRDWHVNEITPPAGNDDGFAGPLVASEANPRLDRVTFTGRLVATHEALKDLEAHRDGWRWALVISDDDLPEPGKPAKEVQARLLFLPLADRFRAYAGQGNLSFEPFNVPVQVIGKR